MPSGVSNEAVENSKPMYCRFCDQPVVRIIYTGTAGRGEVKPYKHAYSNTKVNQQRCHRVNLTEAEVTDVNLWDLDF